VSLNEPPRRRRGEELEHALLDAAWLELTQKGYASFTMEAVAHHAGTSRPVVYRRWPTRQDIVRAAIARAVTQTRPQFPDTGSVREDLVTYMKELNSSRAALAAVLSVQLSAFYQETGTSLADLRDFMRAGQGASVETILERAVARGEIDPEKLTPRRASLPFDLFRHDVLMTLEPVPDETIEEIVDTIFLPLVRRGS
jgi:AcrR family transcriptional regulator